MGALGRSQDPRRAGARILDTAKGVLIALRGCTTGELPVRLQLRDKFLRNSGRIGEELCPKAVRHELREIARLPRASAGWQQCRAAFLRWLALPASFMGASPPAAISRIDTFAASRVLRYLHDGPNKRQTWRD